MNAAKNGGKALSWEGLNNMLKKSKRDYVNGKTNPITGCDFSNKTKPMCVLFCTATIMPGAHIAKKCGCTWKKNEFHSRWKK